MSPFLGQQWRHWTHLQLVLLPVDDDGGDLLVHEDQDGAEQSGNGGGQQRPPGVGSQRGDEPATSVGGRLNRTRKESQRGRVGLRV